MVDHEHVWVEAEVVSGPKHVGDKFTVCGVCFQFRRVDGWVVPIRSCGVCGDPTNHNGVPHSDTTSHFMEKVRSVR